MRPWRNARKRELTGLGQPRALLHRRRDDRAQQDGASVRADLDDVLAGVGVRRGKKGEDRPDRSALVRSAIRD